MRTEITEVAELRAALLDQWVAAHFDHCGRLPHKPGARCHWPPPIVLGSLGEIEQGFSREQDSSRDEI